MKSFKKYLISLLSAVLFIEFFKKYYFNKGKKYANLEKFEKRIENKIKEKENYEKAIRKPASSARSWLHKKKNDFCK